MRTAPVSSGAWMMTVAIGRAVTRERIVARMPETKVTVQVRPMILPVRLGSCSRRSAMYRVAVMPKPRAARLLTMLAVVCTIPKRP